MADTAAIQDYAVVGVHGGVTGYPRRRGYNIAEGLELVNMKYR